MLSKVYVAFNIFYQRAVRVDDDDLQFHPLGAFLLMYLRPSPLSLRCSSSDPLIYFHRIGIVAFVAMLVVSCVTRHYQIGDC